MFHQKVENFVGPPNLQNVPNGMGRPPARPKKYFNFWGLGPNLGPIFWVGWAIAYSPWWAQSWHVLCYALRLLACAVAPGRAGLDAGWHPDNIAAAQGGTSGVNRE